MTNIQQIARYLARPIPAPHRKPPKAAKTWKQLKPGQFLKNLQPIYGSSSQLNEPPDTLWLVESVNSESAKVVTVASNSNPKHYTIREHNWKGVHFDRARKPIKGSLLRSISDKLTTASTIQVTT